MILNVRPSWSQTKATHVQALWTNNNPCLHNPCSYDNLTLTCNLPFSLPPFLFLLFFSLSFFPSPFPSFLSILQSYMGLVLCLNMFFQYSANRVKEVMKILLHRILRQSFVHSAVMNFTAAALLTVQFSSRRGLILNCIGNVSSILNWIELSW